METLTVVRGACPHDCPDTCAWDVTVEHGRAVGLRGVRDHPLTQGRLCAKVNHYVERAYSPQRLLQPLRRVGAKGDGAFEPLAWDDAIELVATRLRSILDEHGGEAILPYSYLGTQGLVQGGAMANRFFALLGASRLTRAICGSSAFAGYLATQGSPRGMLPEDLVHSRLILLWGTNTIVTNSHLWPFLTAARERGARIVVIDPVRTRTARAADLHLRPRPGTDTALALGLAHVILRDGLEDADYLARHANGLDAFRGAAAPYDPDTVEAITGVDAADVEQLARDYATVRPAAIRTLIGLGHHERAAMCFRTLCCLPPLVGAWRELGGGIVGTTAWAAWGPLAQAALDRPELARAGLRELNMVEIGRALTECEPAVRALVVYNSNPAAIAPEQQLVLEGLRRDDLFTVVVEQFMTDTALHADVVLPATTQLEHLDLVPSWGSVYVSLNRPAIEPLGESLPNSEIFRRLGRRLGLGDEHFAESDEELVRSALASESPLLADVDFERLLRDGYARVALPDPWLPYAEGGFSTPSGKVELGEAVSPPPALAGPPRFEPALESPAGDPELAARYPLQLVTGKWSLHFLNSSYANLPRHLAAEGRLSVEIAAGDAAQRGIASGDRVRVFNDRGSVLAQASVGEVVEPGVVALPSGWWASLVEGGASANTLTPVRLTDAGGGCAFHDTLVEVAPVAAAEGVGERPASERR